MSFKVKIRKDFESEDQWKEYLVEWRKYAESGQARKDHEHYINVDRYKLGLFNKTPITSEFDCSLTHDIIRKGIWIIELLERVSLVETRSEARRLIKQGGIYINNKRITDINLVVDLNIVETNFIIGAGKKRRKRVQLL